MDRLSIVTLGAAKAYTNASIAGGGAIKGKNCQIKSSTPITGGTRITFAWYLDNDTEQTTTVDVMDGVDGAKGDTGNGVKSASIVENHLILTLDDDTTVDAGLLTNLDTTFEHIDDISLNNLADGQILKYNATTGKWENASAGTVDTSLVDLNDVSVDNLTDGQIIVWDATAGRWKNANNSPSITVDPTPTQGSDNAVASGGVYTALQGKADSSDVPTKTSDLTNDSGFQTASDVATAISGKVDTSAVGTTVASLTDGKVPASQLPSYVDDVIEAEDAMHFPVTGESGKIYVALDTNKTYRWSGSGYVEISESLALGETSSTAYAGNKGKANADAIDAIKDGTTIDSFSDVESALDDKADASDIPEEMPAVDMSEVVTPLPSVMSRRFKYSTQEQIIGEWIDGKPLYQKVVTVASATNWNAIYTIENADYIEIATARYYYGETGVEWIKLNYTQGNDRLLLATDSNKIVMTIQGFTAGSNNPVNMVLRYTKTTDTVTP